MLALQYLDVMKTLYFKERALGFVTKMDNGQEVETQSVVQVWKINQWLNGQTMCNN